jgi:hypothetical protein
VKKKRDSGFRLRASGSENKKRVIASRASEEVTRLLRSSGKSDKSGKEEVEEVKQLKI